MSFEQLLFEQYGIHSEESIIVDDIKGYKKGEYIYFIIFAENKEIIHMEQATLAYFVAEKFPDYIAIPIPNVQGEWFSRLNESAYIVLQIKISDWSHKAAGGGEELAHFHQFGSTYNYEPQTISSYGQWRTLWIDKLSYFEKKTATMISPSYSKWNESVNDALPYIIGVSENAIQYMQESEQERRFHENDQGSIAFHRYYDQLEQPFLWPTDLVYDHPVRDLAEKIRYMILNKEYQEVSKFLHDYQAIRPLSVFSWRLLYARLLCPIHIFDCMATGFTSENPDYYASDLQELLNGQDHYESFLKNLYDMAGAEVNALHLPVLHWL
ncbi:hypothetical protein [Virgibacillus sp. SK37]|uniref:hypothetical protein n=1 Tax=Virgibacillus sp. SK37 TaxID=403957 RepID=UPI0004D1DC16|nr:hypothetical protein [Virgibacillus sp. SK37]AIF44029.1 hypothetical protein X953_13425 [Virgibacillus sp. SK37]